MWLNLDLLPCTVTGSWIDVDLCLTGSRVPGTLILRDAIIIMMSIRKQHTTVADPGWKDQRIFGAEILEV